MTCIKALIKHGDSAIPVTSIKNKTAIKGTNVTGNEILDENVVKQLREYYKKNQ